MCHNKIRRKLVFLQPLITSKQAITVMKIDWCQIPEHKLAFRDLTLFVTTWPRHGGQGLLSREPCSGRLHPLLCRGISGVLHATAFPPLHLMHLRGLLHCCTAQARVYGCCGVQGCCGCGDAAGCRDAAGWHVQQRRD